MASVVVDVTVGVTIGFCIAVEVLAAQGIRLAVEVWIVSALVVQGRRAERRRLYVRPYWRGPVDGPAHERVYRVSQ